MCRENKEVETIKYKGIIFDLDGTLLDSIPVWSKVGEKFLESQGIAPPPQLKKALKKKSLRQAAEYFIETFRLDFAADEIITRINNIVEHHYKNTIPLKPYVREFLNYLRDKNVKMCIATASNKELVERALDRHGILSYFEFVLTCEEVGVGKDQPDIFIQAVQRLGLNIKDVLIFEDSIHCIKTAKNAGFKVVGVYEQSAGDRVKEMKILSDYFIYSFQEIKNMDLFV